MVDEVMNFKKKTVLSDIPNLISALSEHIHLNTKSPIREYISNAVDACTSVKNAKIQIFLQDKKIIFIDNGVGMNEEEVDDGFARIGGSLDSDAGWKIGTFGIGVCSAFGIASRIIVESKKANSSGIYMIWDKGRSYYEISKKDIKENGTKVIFELLDPYQECFTRNSLGRYIAKTFGLVNVPIYIDYERTPLNPHHRWINTIPQNSEVISCEKKHTRIIKEYHPVYCSSIYVKKNCKGMIILGIPNRQYPAYKTQSISIFSKGVQISNSVDSFLPLHQSFFSGIIDIPELKLKLDRTAFHQDEIFIQAKNEIQSHINSYLFMLDQQQPELLDHAIQTQRSYFLGIADTVPELYSILKDKITFDTNQGPRNMIEIKSQAKVEGSKENIALISKKDEGRSCAVKHMANSNGKLVTLVDELENRVFSDIAVRDHINMEDFDEQVSVRDVNNKKTMIFLNKLRSSLERYGIAQIHCFEAANDQNFSVLIEPATPKRTRVLTFVKTTHKEKKYSMSINFSHWFIKNILQNMSSYDEELFQALAEILVTIGKFKTEFQQNEKDVLGDKTSGYLMDLVSRELKFLTTKNDSGDGDGFVTSVLNRRKSSFKSILSLNPDTIKYQLSYVGYFVNEIEKHPIGTGIVISKNHVLTCLHVVQNNLFNNLFKCNKYIYPLHLVQKQEDLDLAVLRSDININLNNYPTFMKNFTSNHGLRMKQRIDTKSVYSVGYSNKFDNLGRCFLDNEGTMHTDLVNNQILALSYPHGGLPEGFSGGPTLIERESNPVIIGIQYLGKEHAATSRIIASDVILKFLKNCSILIPEDQTIQSNFFFGTGVCD